MECEHGYTSGMCTICADEGAEHKAEMRGLTKSRSKFCTCKNREPGNYETVCWACNRPYKRARADWLCRCGEKHGRVKMRWHLKLADFHPFCVRCGGWLTDEQCRNLDEGGASKEKPSDTEAQMSEPPFSNEGRAE